MGCVGSKKGFSGKANTAELTQNLNLPDPKHIEQKPNIIDDLTKNKQASTQKLKKSRFQQKQAEIIGELPQEFKTQFYKQKNQLLKYYDDIESDIIKMKKDFDVITKPGNNYDKTLYFTKHLNLNEVNQMLDKECKKMQNGSAVMKQYTSLRGGADDDDVPQYFMQYHPDENSVSNNLKEAMKGIYQMKTSIDLNKQFVDGIEEYNTFHTFKQNFDTLFEQIEQKMTNGQKKQTDKNYHYIDVAIVMDTTGSMIGYLDKAKEQSKNIFSDLKKRYPFGNFKYAFIGYKDHTDSKMLDIINFEESVDKVTQQISKIVANGGGDEAEAMHDALMAAATTLKWRKTSQKFVFVICDAPPHGKEYGCADDKYPQGCPCGIELSSIVSAYKKQNINIILKKANIKDKDTLLLTQQIFKQNFPKGLYNCSNVSVKQFATEIANDIQIKMEELIKIKQTMTTKYNEVVVKICQKMKNALEVEVKKFQELKLAEKSGQFMQTIQQDCLQKQKKFKQLIEKYTIKQTTLNYAAAFQYMLQIHHDKQMYFATVKYLNIIDQLDQNKRNNQVNIQNYDSRIRLKS